jgi:hypothetical protein
LAESASIGGAGGIYMNIFDFMREEEDITVKRLQELVKDFFVETREEGFDKVKLILDILQGHCDKQKALLLDKLPELDKSDTCKRALADTIEARDNLIAEIGDLVMVHVDEPGYKEYLVKLLRTTQNYFDVSKKLYKTLQETLPKESIKSLDEGLTAMIHSDTGFNTLQETPSKL